MRKKELSIKHIVDNRRFGFYIETDLVNNTIVIGKGIKRRCLALWEAERLEFLLKRQIDRIKGDYPKEEVKKDNVDVIENTSSQAWTDNIQFEKCMKRWLEKQHKLKFYDAVYKEEHEKMDPVEENMEKTLRHFAISPIDVADGFYIRPNTQNARNRSGISAVEGDCKGEGKFQITTYYDPEFPSIATYVKKLQ